jgi:hypothetical protein
VIEIKYKPLKYLINKQIKNRYLIYFIIAGVLLGSLLGSLRANALTFGSIGSTGTGTTTENVCVAGYYQMGATDGIADSISAYLTTNALYGGNGKCKIYYGSNGTAIANGVTDEVFIGDLSISFITFPFSGTKPRLNANAYYYLVVFTESDGGTCLFAYLNIGASTTTSKTATYSTFPTTWTSTTSIDSSSTPRIYCTYNAVVPTAPTNFIAKPNGINSYNINLAWTKGTDAVYTRIMYKTTGFPTNHLDGILAYNNTGSSYTLTGLTKSTLYYFSAWSYNSGTFSTTYTSNANTTLPSFSILENLVNSSGITTVKQLSNNTIKIYSNYTGSCSSNNLTVYNNSNLFLHGGYETTYSSSTGWKVYLNYTAWSHNMGLSIAPENCTIDYSYTYNEYTGYDITILGYGYPNNFIFNVSNANVTYYYVSNFTSKSYDVYINVTGNVTIGNCSGIYWFNYTDDNVTINISFNKQTNSFIDDYEINEENWLSLAGALLFDNSQFFIIILLSLWLFFISKYLEHKDLTVALMQFGLSIPLCIIVAVISLSFAFGYIIVFLIPTISLILLADGFFYSKKKR